MREMAMTWVVGHYRAWEDVSSMEGGNGKRLEVLRRNSKLCSGAQLLAFIVSSDSLCVISLTFLKVISF
jgi:hypothetical protein